MKWEISAKQLVHFRQNGHIRFEPSPFPLPPLDHSQEKRDLWRTQPLLKKTILRSLGPLILELTGKQPLRLLCDQWIETPLPSSPFSELFCFQGITVILSLTPSSLDVYDPSSLASQVPAESYLVVFGCDPVRFINNPKDPYLLTCRKMGYQFGDVIISEFHPLLFPY